MLPMLSLASCGFLGKKESAQAVPSRASEAALLFAQAQGLESQQEFGKAIKTYRRIADKYPRDENASFARFRQAWLLDHAGESKDAFIAYQSFIERYPSDELYARAIERQEAVAHAAAQGQIQTSFFGLKSNLDSNTVTEMFKKVRENAPAAASAPRAQFGLGQFLERRKRAGQAIAAYESLVGEFPKSSYGPSAQFRIGEILLQSAQAGNQDQANLERAKNAYEDLLLAYPSSEFAEQAKQRLASIDSKDMAASYDVAEFYRKKKQYASAAYYYQDVLDGASPQNLKDQAAVKLQGVNQFLKQ